MNRDRHELCRCHACGSVDSYDWLLGIHHFPLKCLLCGERAVYQIDPDNITVEDIESLWEFGDEIEGFGEGEEEQPE